MAGAERLGPDDWADAALAALLEGGLAEVAVEPLARRLGVTKGSFYWHFADRAALLAAALARWEHTSTEAIIADLGALEDPSAILTRLAERTLEEPRHGLLELALSGAVAEPLVRAALVRVLDRRLSFLCGVIGAAGIAPRVARDRAILAYACFTGLHHLLRVAPRRLPHRRQRAAFVREWVRSVLARPARLPSSASAS